MFKYLILIACLVGALSATAFPPGLVPMLDGRIVGGRPVDIAEYPHQISMQYYGSHRCGGSIIGDGKTILTAAHCVEGVSAKNLQVRVGSSFHNEGGQLIQVTEIRKHEKYNSWTIDYDVAIMKLAEQVKTGAKAQIISLNRAAMKGGELAKISGWGATREGGSIPKQLQAVDIEIVSQSVCRQQYGSSRITDRMLCGGVNGGGKDSCQGDSGGPLIVNGQQAGVVSWGSGCARPNYSGVYANVQNLLPWIEENSA
ncbi:trypsin delta-like [Condylostylus longicornis]|uniref:trypsin delta-like n=1 Tax=Condylostylus longicornis TaxID=2530218 RepID=UPI00244DEB54|nr:trypsin delta-like [Condylostylus longicornis]